MGDQRIKKEPSSFTSLTSTTQRRSPVLAGYPAPEHAVPGMAAWGWSCFLPLLPAQQRQQTPSHFAYSNLPFQTEPFAFYPKVALVKGAVTTQAISFEDDNTAAEASLLC